MSSTSATATLRPAATEPAAGKPGGYRHLNASGFCSVCGSVWPCARSSAPATQAAPPLPIPVDRRSTL